MNIVQITPGAGGMYCGNCLRDNSIVAPLRALGHYVLMVPLYLPLTLDEPDQSAGIPIFFSGINVYLDQKIPLFRGAPGWVHRLFASRPLLKWAGKRAAKTRAADLGEMTLSMLQGESGNQARELDDLIAWLKTQPTPDVICLSNVLLIGMARRLKSELQTRVIGILQGEDSFLDALPESHRALCYQTVAQRAAEIDGFIAPSQYFADRMGQRLGLESRRIKVVYNGINLQGYEIAERPAPSGSNPSIGFFARMCAEKGLDTLVDAFIELRKRGKVSGRVKLRVGGSCGPADEIFVARLRQRLAVNSLLDDVEFHPNVTRADKIEFLKSLSIFSVPARYGEAFGLYVIEALAAGVPVVLPRTAAFPELIRETGGGLLFEPDAPSALSRELENLLLDPERARALGEAGRRTVFERFTSEAMAVKTLEVFEQAQRG